MSRDGDCIFTLKRETLVLTPEKGMYWKEKETLIISDVHLGKAGHFRKAGIAVPKSLNDQNLNRIDVLISVFSPKKILFLGDLFHSDINREWDSFASWRKEYSEIKMLLVLGNHDFHDIEEYNNLDLIPSTLIKSPPFLFAHDHTEVERESSLYTFAGHVHPSIRMIGKGRQKLRVPCFFFGKSHALLPAFGTLTGTYSIKPTRKEPVFACLSDQIISIQ